MAKTPQVAALFLRNDSIYKSMEGVDCYDIERDARSWKGGAPIVAHPPCRAWGHLKHFAKPRPGEKRLAVWSIIQIRRHGGVLEHPKGSQLWKQLDLRWPNELPDEWGGYTIEVDQFHWGHKARKRTWLYIVGCPLNALPPIPHREGEPTHVVDRTGKARKRERPNSAGKKPWVTKAEREATPPAFAEWLVTVARRCRLRAPPGGHGPSGPPTPHADAAQAGGRRREAGASTSPTSRH